MAQKQNKYGNVVASGNLENGIPFEVATASNPFGESYLIITIKDEMVAGLIIDKNRKDVIECRNKVAGTIKIEPSGASTTEAPSRTLDN